jgi:rRNA-processing protein FCF1
MLGSQLGLPATYWWPRIHLVVEGQARDVENGASSVTVERAPGSGDDLIAAVVQDAVMRRPQDHVVVVTADRELRGRVEHSGASTIGPRALDQLLDT